MVTDVKVRDAWRRALSHTGVRRLVSMGNQWVIRLLKYNIQNAINVQDALRTQGKDTLGLRKASWRR